MSSCLNFGKTEGGISRNIKPMVLGPSNSFEADPLRAYDLKIWDQMSQDIREWNDSFSYDRKYPVGKKNPLQLLAVAYDEKTGHDLAEGLGSMEALEEAVEYSRGLGLNVVYRWNGLDEDLARDSHEVYVTKDSEMAYLATDQKCSFYSEDEIYGQLMGFREEDIQAYRDWEEIGNEFQPSKDDSIHENLDNKKDFITSRGGRDSILSHRGVVRGIAEGKEYNFRDFLGAYRVFDNRVIDDQDRLQDLVESVRSFDLKLREDVGRGIVQLEGGERARRTFDEHLRHYKH